MRYETYDDYMKDQEKFATVWVCDHCGDKYDSEPPELECPCKEGKFREMDKEEYEHIEVR